MKKVINRRGFLRTGLTAGTAISLPVSVWADDYPSDIVAMTALQLSEAIRDKKVSCREVMQAYLTQIEARATLESVLEQARHIPGP